MEAQRHKDTKLRKYEINATRDSYQDVIIEPMNRHQWAPRPLCLRAFVVHNGTTKTQRHEAKRGALKVAAEH